MKWIWIFSDRKIAEEAIRREQLEQERIAAEEAEQERQAELARQAGNDFFLLWIFNSFHLDEHFIRN